MDDVKIGRGMYGTVYQSIHQGDRVAVKIPNKQLHSEGGLSPSTLMEIHVLKSLQNNPYIVGLRDIVFEPDTKIYMDWYPYNMREYISITRFEERFKLYDSVLDMLVNALKHLYEIGIIHRDIKPDNILMNTEGDCCLCDFGAAAQLPHDVRYRDISLCLEVYTPMYRPPEIVAGNPYYTSQADVWALGMTMLEYIIGRRVIDRVDDANPLNSILSVLTVHTSYTKEVEVLIKDHRLEDSVNVSMILFTYPVPPSHIDVLVSMLQVDPNKRDTPKPSSTVDTILPCKSGPRRGDIIPGSGVTATVYESTIIFLLRLANARRISIDAVLVAFDLFERYLSSYPVAADRAKLIGLTCIWITEKLLDEVEVGAQEYTAISDITVEDMVATEIDIVKKMDYILYHCEIETYLFSLKKTKRRYPEKFRELLRNLYLCQIAAGIHPGSRPYPI
jgi:serine/threonine protein kinase